MTVSSRLRRVPIHGNNYERISGWQGTLDWDESVFELVEITGSDELHVNLAGAEAGWLSFNHYVRTAEDRSPEEELFTLVLRAKEDFRLSEQLSLTSSVTPSEAYRGRNEKVDLRLRSRMDPVVEIMSVNPNPWITSTTIEFHLPRASKALWEFFDVTGRLLHTRQTSYLEGLQKEIFQREEMNATGVIYARLTTEDGIAEQKMILVD